ncbi:MAG TPA: 3-dehydroquinate synthase [Syntrophales bacterium]|nr:3-dehydroquinate synthase [Syntrophales bacterium]
MKKIKVHLHRAPSLSYEVHIGSDILDQAAVLMARKFPAGRYVVITDTRVEELHGQAVRERWERAGLKADWIAMPAGEGAKNMETVLTVAERLLELGADRNTPLIALGGGVVGDLAGFIASIYMRSVPFLNIPTTLLAQVDSCLGGKTAVDLPAGKNLLGTFYQPKAVFADLKFLETLPAGDFRNGLGEIVKYALLDAEFFSELEASADGLRRGDQAVLGNIVERSIRIKKGIVEMDEHDQGIRRILNLGHTVGHAIEAESGFAIAHGEAVGMGIAAAIRLSERLHGFPAADRRRTEALMDRAGLPAKIPAAMRAEALVGRLSADKKKEGRSVRFVMLRRIGLPFVNGGIAEDVLIETIEEMKR